MNNTQLSHKHCRVGVGNVRPPGRIRPAELKLPAPDRFLNFNGIRPANKNNRPASEFTQRVNKTTFYKTLYHIFTKQNCKNFTSKTC